MGNHVKESVTIRPTRQFEKAPGRLALDVQGPPRAASGEGASMNEVMTQKVAVIDELKAKVDSTNTAVVTEYRGMTVAQISELRRTLRGHGADFKVFKNTLVRRAIAGTP
ncbi:MAG: 50S ribosomal protein L10, partial [Actinobacteria bacterium]|nr:50S ribosomal protein L10 [Actinomycetota bacterium]